MNDPAIQQTAIPSPSAKTPSLEAARERVGEAVKNLDKLLGEKLKRDQVAAQTPDPELTARIDELKTEVKKLTAENARLRGALESASGKLDTTIERLNDRLNTKKTG